MCALLLHYLPWCIHWKWPYTSVNMSSHWWWHPKSLTSAPLPHCGTPQHQWAALQFLWWLSIILDNVSQWQSRHHSKVIFTPTVSRAHARGGRGEASSFPGRVTLHLFLSVSLFWYLRDTRNRKGHCTLSRFPEVAEGRQICHCRCQGLDLKTWASFRPLTSRLHLLHHPLTRRRELLVIFFALKKKKF